MSNIIQRVTHLLTLAADSGAAENEARTAAFQAARLIAKHSLRVVEAHDPSTTATHTTTQKTTHTTTATWSTWDNVDWKSAFDAAWERAEREAREARARTREAQAEDERRKNEFFRQPRYPWTAQETSECGSCGATIDTGSSCYYGPHPTHGWRCVPCADRDAPPRRKRTKRKTAKAKSK
jgi:hypothetical protein